jgi:hypothetical protein
MKKSENNLTVGRAGRVVHFKGLKAQVWHKLSSDLLGLTYQAFVAPGAKGCVDGWLTLSRPGWVKLAQQCQPYAPMMLLGAMFDASHGKNKKGVK